MNSKASFLGLQLFVFAIIILFINDFYFKSTFPGIITGKLSDLVGLYSFAWFLSSVFSRLRLSVHLLVAAFFIYWKTPFSTPFINWFSFYFYPIDRVVDYSDYLTLPVLFLSWRFSPGNLLVFSKSYLRNSLLLFSCFTFAASSMPSNIMEFDSPLVVLLDKKLVKDIHVERNYRYEVDSFVVLFIDNLDITREDIYGDDFDKKMVMSKVGEIQECNNNNSNIDTPIKLKSFLAKGNVGFKHRIGDKVYQLSFLDGRLNGSYYEYVDDLLQLSGYYKYGIPDSTWNYYGQNGELLKQHIYEEGERIYENIYQNKNVSEVKIFRTRKDIQRDYIIVFLLSILTSLGIIYLMFRKYQYARMEITIWNRIILIFIILICSALILIAGINLLGLKSEGVFGFFLDGLVCMTISVPFLLLLTYFLPFEHYFDAVIYGLIFGLLWLSISELNFILKLTKGADIIDCFTMVVNT